MQYDKYPSLAVSVDSSEFKFVSEGPKGNIVKLVQFRETTDPAIYNLAFGDLLPDGSVDDHVKNNNRDRNKILATIAAAVYEFTARNPDKLVYFTGSTPERTRLYRMAITTNLEELAADFEIFGLNPADERYVVEPFVTRRAYFAFLVQRKIT